MTGKRQGPDITLVRNALAEHKQMFHGVWKLPIVFERDGENLVGRLDMAVSCDLMKMGREQAERDIARAMQQAILIAAMNGAKP